MPSSALATASATTTAVEPATSRPSGPNATTAVSDRLDDRDHREREPVAEQQVELGRAASTSAARASRVVRSRSIVIEVTRNIVMNGKRPTSGGADRARRSAGVLLEASLSSGEQDGGTTSSSAIVRGSRRSCVSTRSAVAQVTAGAHAPRPPRSAPGRPPRVVLGRSAAQLRPGSRPRGSPVAHQQQPSQRSASSITWLETSSVVPRRGEPAERRPEVPAQHRVEADRRLVEDQQLGLAEQRRGKRDPGALAAGETGDDLVGVSAEVDGLDHLVDALLADAQHPGEDSAGSRAR